MIGSKGSRSAKVNVFVGAGYHDACLKIAQLEELQEATNSGPSALLRRLSDSDFRVRDITETIRLGLIGGGMSPKDAFDMTRKYVCEGYLIHYMPVAYEIIVAALVGVEDEPVGEPVAPTTEEVATDSGSSLPTTPSAEPLDSAPAK